MASLLSAGRLGLRAAGINRQRQAVARRPLLQRVAAIDPPATFSPGSSEQEALAASSEQEELQIADLDAAQESLLKWMLFVDGDDQARGRAGGRRAAPGGPAPAAARRGRGRAPRGPPRRAPRRPPLPPPARAAAGAGAAPHVDRRRTWRTARARTT
jgi:hypothetical protein